MSVPRPGPDVNVQLHGMATLQIYCLDTTAPTRERAIFHSPPHIHWPSHRPAVRPPPSTLPRPVPSTFLPHSSGTNSSHFGAQTNAADSADRPTCVSPSTCVFMERQISRATVPHPRRFLHSDRQTLRLPSLSATVPVSSLFPTIRFASCKLLRGRGRGPSTITSVSTKIEWNTSECHRRSQLVNCRRRHRTTMRRKHNRSVIIGRVLTNLIEQKWDTPLSLAKIWPIISHNLETV